MEFEITEEHEGVGEISTGVRDGIRNADPPDVGRRDYSPLALGLRDGTGSLRGGAYGATMWGWLMLDGLWIAPELRGRGHGARLLAAAEAVARERGCRGVWLGTFDFQARSFYEGQGYSVYGQLPDFPAGHTHFSWPSDSAAPRVVPRASRLRRPNRRIIHLLHRTLRGSRTRFYFTRSELDSAFRD